jgi:transcriptional regulator NrdR family protein
VRGIVFTQKNVIYPLDLYSLACQYIDMQLNIGNTKVVNSRFFKGQNVVWRRRKTSDGIVFTTRERVDLSGTTVQKNGSRPREAYQPAKLLISLISSLSHRNNAVEAAWALFLTIENKLLDSALNSPSGLNTESIAKSVLETLKAYDIDGYLTYARHHTNLVSKEDMLDALKG